jgi:transposase-like protein
VSCELFRNSQYEVRRMKLDPAGKRAERAENLDDALWLVVTHRDGQAVRDWRHLQLIKKAIAGPGREARTVPGREPTRRHGQRVPPLRLACRRGFPLGAEAPHRARSAPGCRTATLRSCGGLLRAHRLYSDEMKREAVELYKRHGLSSASSQAGVAKDTLLRWARDAGISPEDSEQITRELSERNRRAAAASHAKSEA